MMANSIPFIYFLLLVYSCGLWNRFETLALALELTPVQSTALLTSYWRSVETENPEGLIRDPTATVLMKRLLTKPKQKQDYDTSPILDMGVGVLALRTQCIDDWLSNSTRTTGTTSPLQRCIVNLGAGMCGRPYRIPFSSQVVGFLEVDSDPSLLHLKRQVLEEEGFGLQIPSWQAVGANLQEISATKQVLKSALNKVWESTKSTSTSITSPPSRSVDWIAEGLLEYLDPALHVDLLGMAYDLSPPQSRMILQILEPTFGQIFEDALAPTKSQLPWTPLKPACEIVEIAQSAGWDRGYIWDCQKLCDTYERPSYHVPGFTMVFLEKD